MQPSKQPWYVWIEHWYLPYALIGLVVAGLIPVIIPLMVSRSGGAGQVGLIMAALSLGGLTSPLWGWLADRYRFHRWLLAGGMLLAAAGLGLFIYTTNPIAWFALAFIQGLGTASAATVANLFVVEAHPNTEWDERIGWLQTFYGIGQVAGLLLAGLLTQVDYRIGLLAAAFLSVGAALWGWWTTVTPPAQPGDAPVLLHPARHTESVISSPQRLFHGANLQSLKNLSENLFSPYGFFLLTWLLAFAGPAAFFSQYPILMQKVYSVSPATSSLAFAIIAGLGLGLYTPAGALSERRTPKFVLRVSQMLRLLAFIVLLYLALQSTGQSSTGLLALCAFAFVVWAWSLMSVSGTALAARLSPVGEGQGMGIFNAITACAGVLGAMIGGWVAAGLGYIAIVVFALLGVGIGLALGFF